MRVGVLYNRDYSAEQDDYTARADVEKTAHAVAAAVDAAVGHTAVLVPVEGKSLAFVDKLNKIDVVFNLCETLAGRSESEVVVPAILDMLGIPYTGSGVLTLATSLRKDRTKEILRTRGVPTPASVVMEKPPKKAPSFGFPAIVKPNREDGSLGISMKSVVKDLKTLQAQVREVMRRYAEPAIVEEFVEGREIIVPLFAARPPESFETLALSEIDFSDMRPGLAHIVTYKGKWEEDSDDYRGSTTRLNPKLKPALQARIMRAATEAFTALECEGYARMDLRVSKRDVPYVIDVNPNCDLSPSGGFFRACKAAGMTYADMVAKLLTLATKGRFYV